MYYLSHNTWRRSPWTSHDSFPKGAVRYANEQEQRYRDMGGVYRNPLPDSGYVMDLDIYTVTDDGEIITKIPEEEWLSIAGITRNPPRINGAENLPIT